MNKNIPQRRCAGCYQSFDKNSLFKVVRTPGQVILFDEKGNLDGRGVYVCKNKKCIEKVRKSNAFGRGLKCEIPEEIFTLLEGKAESDG